MGEYDGEFAIKLLGMTISKSNIGLKCEIGEQFWNFGLSHNLACCTLLLFLLSSEILFDENMTHPKPQKKFSTAKACSYSFQKHV